MYDKYWHVSDYFIDQDTGRYILGGNYNLNDKQLIKAGTDHHIMAEVKFAECKLVMNNPNKFLSVLPNIDVHRGSTTVRYCKRVGEAGDETFDISWCDGWLKEYAKRKELAHQKHVSTKSNQKEKAKNNGKK